MYLNLRGGWMLIKYTWLSWMQDRGFFFLLAFGWMMPSLISLFIWTTVSHGSTIHGITGGEFVAYYLVFIVVSILTHAQTNWTVGDAIHSGSLNVALLRPLSPFFNTIAAEVAGRIVYLSFVVPFTLALALLLHPSFHLTPLKVVVFLFTLVLAWLLRFFWGYWMALIAFWTTRSGSLMSVQDACIFLFAGQVAPLAVFPDSLHLLGTVLPFRYMIGFPVEVLTGHMTSSDLLQGLCYQVLWLIVAVSLYIVLWRNGIRRYTAVGG